MSVAVRVSESKSAKFRVHYSERGSWRRQKLALYRANLVIASVLREIRTAHGVTQTEVAKRLKVSGACICLWEGGHYKITTERAREFRVAILACSDNRRK